MMEIRSNHVLGLSQSGFHRIYYTEWGNPAAEQVVVCVHGLTRNCRDFDTLAQALAGDCYVVCPDVAGRGRSDWLPNKLDYNYPQYLADMNALIARITTDGRKQRVYWVGTSMGGLIGMLLAAQPGTPIVKLVMNDVGPLVPKAALERIGHYVGKDPHFGTLDELEAYVRLVSASFGPLTDAQWRHLTETGAKQFDDGSWGMVYDPAIGDAFRNITLTDVDLWQYWDHVSCPTLVTHGTESDLLLPDIVSGMRERGPRPRIVEFPGVGHAPMLMAEDQVRAVRNFLLASPASQ
ncbi:MAG TPA: alpha/beta hydrolase [Burkholderiales bacterium]|nr:alpha/beta hydrolase [Burkholderiales bacterium]